MPGRLALDFGTTNTVVALWDPDRQDGRTLALADLARALTDPQGREPHAVPSLVHYHDGGLWVGQQVLARRLGAALPGTFRWMKTYVGNQMRLPRTIAGQSVDNLQAAADFLRQVLIAAGAYANLAEDDVAFTVPVEAFEHYQNWLDGVVLSAGVGRPRYVDEASAAALGYAAKIRAGAPFMTVDFGGGTLDVSIVRVDQADTGEPRCRVLGKAGAQVGGSAIDQWLARDAAKQAGRDPAQLRAFMLLLLEEAERVKESLSTAEAEDFTAMDPDTGAVVHHRYSRGAFEGLLDANGLYTKLHAVLDDAEGKAEEHGYKRDHLQAVLRTGGSSLIPSVRLQVRGRYGDRVRSERPFDAVAVGAAAYVAGAGFDDRIRHSYALRPYDRPSGQYVFTAIVHAGTPYPCEVMKVVKPGQPAERLVLTIKASHDQQTRLGLQVYEVAERSSVACGGDGVDLVFDQNGGARFRRREDEVDVTHRPIGSATFVPCDPPAKIGEPRFLATLSVDAQKHLCVTVQDTAAGKTLYRDHPMVKLA